MLEYGQMWAKQNNVISKPADYVNDEIEQKRLILFAIKDYFGPRSRPPYTGGFSTYNALRSELLYNGGLGWDDDDWDNQEK